MIDGHGDDIYKYGQQIVSNFSSNIYGKQDLSVLQLHLCSCMNLINSYPEPDATSLVRLLGETHSIGYENICVTNGATEAIYLIAQACQGSNTAIIIPTFSEYDDACQINKHKLSFYERLEDVDSQVEMIWICNPNNPNGYVYDIDYLEEMVNQRSETLFVFDQSYGHFTDKKVWDIKKASNYKNVILLHSMTKKYSVPGLRLGYMTAHKEIIKHIEKFRMPWSVNSLAVEAGKFLIQNTENYLDINNYLGETKRLQVALRLIDGLTVYPTDTHFFLCKLKNKTASSLKSWLVENYGILIRDASNFRGLDKHFFRIATQSPEENNLLVKAIQKWM